MEIKYVIILNILIILIISINTKQINKKLDNKIKFTSKEKLVSNTIIKSNTTINLFQQFNILTTINDKNQKELTFYGLMIAGAIARSISATAVHPLNVIKTMLQMRSGKMPPLTWKVLSRGAGTQFIMSIPHGALNFVVTESMKKELAFVTNNSTLSRLIPFSILNPVLDLFSSAISTFICSIVSTPQMVLTDKIMAGVCDNMFQAIYSIYSTYGISGFYIGWLPSVFQKIPSYSMTWMFFQQLKNLFLSVFGRAGTSIENTILGSIASAGVCCIMMPIDTIKTRIVTQPMDQKVYHGIWDCFIKILRTEGVGSFYKALPARLLSVVPMMGIQYAVYELLKRLMLGQPPPKLAIKQKIKK